MIIHIILSPEHSDSPTSRCQSSVANADDKTPPIAKKEPIPPQILKFTLDTSIVLNGTK